MTATSETPSESDQVALPTRRIEKNFFAEFLDLMSWTRLTIVELPQALRYPTEVLRQAAIMVLSSTLVLWAMLFAGGFYIGEIGHYVLAQVGAQAYAGLFASGATIKAVDAVFFGFMASAKIGCGFVAELGAMRINQEIDALRVMGVPTRPYLVGTRVWAGIITIPFMFLSGCFVAFLACYIVDVMILGTASPGGFLYVFWTFTAPSDIFFSSMIWCWVPSVLAIIFACYFGYNATGGPVGVGYNTARSMAFNLTMVNVLGAGVFFQLFYGTNVVLPIGN